MNPKKTRNRLQLIGIEFLLCSLGYLSYSTPALSQATATQKNVIEREGRYDFDFEIGTWKTHLTRLQHPLTGSTTWVDYDGTSIVRKIWNGRANLVELKVDGPAGHIEGLSLRLYNPEAHQWSLN